MTIENGENEPHNAVALTGAPTLRDVLDAIETDMALSATQRRDLLSAVRRTAEILGTAPEQLPADVKALAARLEPVLPIHAGLSRKSMQNIKSSLIKALEIFGSAPSKADAMPAPSPAWLALLDRVKGPQKLALSSLAKVATARGVDPGEISDADVAALQSTLESRSLSKSPRKVVQRAISAWNRAVGTIDDWPNITLTRLPPVKEPWTLELSAFPKSFQDDLERWMVRLAKPDLFDDDGPIKPLRPATLKHRRFQIREAASALVHSGRPVEAITSLSILVERGNFEKILKWMMKRFGDKPTEAIVGLGTCLRSVARHHVGLEGRELEWFSTVVSRMSANADRSRKKNERRLAQFEDTDNMARFLGLSVELVREAKRIGAKNKLEGARLLQAALAIEILLSAPMRVGNLAGLHLVEHMRTIRDTKGRRIEIYIPEREVKNSKALHYQLTTDCTALLELYLAEAHPLLSDAPTPYIFPTRDGRAKRAAHLSEHVSKTIRQYTGLEVNAHLFRSLAGKIHNMVRPGDVATLSQVLHNSHKTAMQSYAQFEKRRAIEHYQASLEQVRRGHAA